MARVSCGDEDSNRTNFIDSPRQTVEQVGGKRALLAQALGSQFTATAMKPDGSDYGSLPISRMLGDTAGNHAGQNVPGSARRHGRRTGRVDPGFSIRKRN